MKKQLYKLSYLFVLVLMICLCFGCKKKPKHKWMEVGAEQNPTPIAPGVHPERGTESDAVKIVLAPIYYPVGMDKTGKPQYKKYLYEMEELTPETVDEALKNMRIIDEESLFCDLVIEDSDEVLNAGPGATDSQLTKKGIVRYVDLSSSADNSDQYSGKTKAKDLVGYIGMDDIMYCIKRTFEENFQLVSCDVEPVSMEVYEEVHNSDVEE